MKTETLQKLLSHVTSECKTIDREARFDEMLDQCYSFESVGGPFAHMSPSSVLKECDPTAYRCGVNDWADGERWAEIEGEYYDSDDVETAREAFVEEMESEVSDLEDDIEQKGIDVKDLEAQLEDGEGKASELEAEIEALQTELATLNAQLADLRAEIAEVEKYSF